MYRHLIIQRHIAYSDKYNRKSLFCTLRITVGHLVGWRYPIIYYLPHWGPEPINKSL